ncbi:MAG: type I-E CRISPR-associated protein Cas6/Cse3/CasE [Nitrospirae bacterium CG_4_10_14_3_um_filter_70_108]|nr:MAG: type I-E CRISPR-associated protein Cas6/Cse3/CasE [Nitrospirae bacterium CG_4_10_14_3_um_filter_70_108]
MSYFSRVTLDPQRSDAGSLIRQLGAGAYREHQTIWRLFGHDPKAQRDFLYRRDEGQRYRRYYVVSHRQPQDDTGLWRIETKPYTPRLKTGGRLAFSLRANPVVTRVDEDGKRRRHDVVMDAKSRMAYKELPLAKRPVLAGLVEEAGWNWLLARAPKHGFEVSSRGVRVDAYRPQESGSRKRGENIRFSTLDFEGVLTITDADRFVDVLFRGLGPAKAFGCGLLLVRSI